MESAEKKEFPARPRPHEAAISASGLTPLQYVLGTMRDERQPVALRLDMAKAAAPYVHPRLASVEQTGMVNTHEPVAITVEFVEPDGTYVKSLRGKD